MGAESEAAEGRPGDSPDGTEELANERLQRLEERERLANLRELEADERERVADERERVADERELEADEREQRLGVRAALLRQRSKELRKRTIDARERAEQAVEAAAVVLNANSERTGRAEAALDRARARASRDQADADRAINRGEPHPPGRTYDFRELADRVSALRERTAAAAAHLAESEEAVARLHEQFAAREPGIAAHRRVAHDAREAARRARAIEAKFGSR